MAFDSKESHAKVAYLREACSEPLQIPQLRCCPAVAAGQSNAGDLLPLAGLTQCQASEAHPPAGADPTV